MPHSVWPGGLKPVFRGGLRCRDLVQRRLELFAGSPLNHLPHSNPSRNLFRNRRRNNPLDGNLLTCSKVGDLSVYRIRECDAECHATSPIIAVNSRGETTRMPNCWAPAKSLLLYVTKKSARLSTASSRTKSSFASGSFGLQRAVQGPIRFRLWRRGISTPCMKIIASVSTTFRS